MSLLRDGVCIVFALLALHKLLPQITVRGKAVSVGVVRRAFLGVTVLLSTGLTGNFKTGACLEEVPEVPQLF